mmetsp:Transcript_26676/g.61376  ORF Transcript_26676/g.61376 Transcript_26676/m.61376 type:complete len:101 (-) Transcript_26676:1328-1630(-)
MPPNADHLRNRVSGLKAVVDVDDEPETLRLIPTKDLAENEVAIDGIVYDLNGFDHPGGDQIMMMGGNDVTVQYKMIHPHHTGKQLDKLKSIGKLTDYKPE